MQVWCCWQVTLCDPHLSALEVRFSRRCAIQIDVYLYLTLPTICVLSTIIHLSFFTCQYVCIWYFIYSANSFHPDPNPHFESFESYWQQRGKMHKFNKQMLHVKLKTSFWMPGAKKRCQLLFKPLMIEGLAWWTDQLLSFSAVTLLVGSSDL